ncbi:hypothetical protein [Streptomyces sp. NPDC002133]|uniref:hypothetical protein n=1 Tax=Streptomyces sp. NPDC002133 TaxID=3154409 RepID=UPI00331B93B9
MRQCPVPALQYERLDRDRSDDVWEAGHQPFAGLPADHSRADPPGEGDHLGMDLATCEVARSGKWSLA